MFGFEEYIIGWAVYLVAVVGLLVVFWRMTRSIPWFYFKRGLRLAVAALLLVPMLIPESQGFYAPAWIQGGLLLVFDGVESFLPAGRILALSVAVSLLVYLLLEIVLYYTKRPKTDAN